MGVRGSGLLGGPARAVQTEPRIPFGGFVLPKTLGPRGGRRERGTGEKEEIFHNAKFKLRCLLGRGRPESCRLTKRQCGLVTVRGKHRPANGAVMGGEVTWEKLVQGERAHKFWWRDIPLGRETGTTLTLPTAKARDAPAPRDVALGRNGWGDTLPGSHCLQHPAPTRAGEDARNKHREGLTLEKLAELGRPQLVRQAGAQDSGPLVGLRDTGLKGTAVLFRAFRKH